MCYIAFWLCAKLAFKTLRDHVNGKGILLKLKIKAKK